MLNFTSTVNDHYCVNQGRSQNSPPIKEKKRSLKEELSFSLFPHTVKDQKMLLCIKLNFIFIGVTLYIAVNSIVFISFEKRSHVKADVMNGKQG